MTPPLAIARPEGLLYRVARRPDPWRWPDWNSAHEDGTFGSRFDDPRGEYRVLYASSQREGAFAETLARFRVDLHVAAEQQAIDGDPEDAGYPEPLVGGVDRVLHYGLDEFDAGDIRRRLPICAPRWPARRAA